MTIPLVGSVLDHARIEQGRRVWKMEPCDLSERTADTLRVTEPLAAEKRDHAAFPTFTR